MNSWFQNWVSSTEQELGEIQARFNSFAGTHGDLFEDSVKPLSDEDKKDAVARRKRFSKIFFIVYAVIVVFSASAVIFGHDTLGVGNYIELLALMGVPWLFWYQLMSEFNRALKFNEKRVIQGVVTRKQMKQVGKRKGRADGCFVEFSQKLLIQVLPEVYKTLTLGDIVRMEMLSDDIYMKRKVVVEGKI